jgi:uncharacterized membrane protein
MQQRIKTTILKTISWRILMVITSFVTVMLSTKSVKTSIVATVLLNLVNTLIYFGHEVAWGKAK